MINAIARRDMSTNGNTPVIIAVANRKGGCGKTATAVNLGVALTNENYKVLIIDLDSQANLTTHLGKGLKPFSLTSSDFLVSSIIGKKVNYSDVVLGRGENLRIIPANDTLADAETMLQAEMIKRNGKPYDLLQKSMDTINENFDYIIIDTPPGEGLILRNALAAAHYVLMPGKTDAGSMEGFKRIVRIVQKEIIPFNPRLKLLGIVATMYNPRTHLANAFTDYVRKQYPNALLNAKIRQDIKIPEAHLKGVSIFEYQPYSNGAYDYTQLMFEIIAKTGRRAGQQS